MTDPNANLSPATDLDRARICAALDPSAADTCTDIVVFTEIDSTNSWLLQQPAPAAGTMQVAVADFQSAGRGRRGRHWSVPPGAGVCFSFAWTFASRPEQISSLALAIGVAAREALSELGASPVELKWPNDLIFDNGKLGGILVEVNGSLDAGCTIVAGIGINRILPPGFAESIGDDSTLPPTDLAPIFPDCAVPSREQVTVALINQCVTALREFSVSGFAGFRHAWREADYLKGKLVAVTRGADRIEGHAVGIGENGELLVSTGDNGNTVERIDSGSVVLIADS